MVKVRRSDVVAGALRLVDTAGLEGLTMRKLAADLDLQAGSLYYHFASKQSLVDAMADKLIEAVEVPDRTMPWDERLADSARQLRRALLSHRDGGRVVAGTQVAERNTVEVARVWIDVFDDAGLSQERATWAAFALFSFVLGHVIEEQSLTDGNDRRTTGAASAGGLPDRLASVFSIMVNSDPVARFDFGLAVFLHGLRQYCDVG